MTMKVALYCRVSTSTKEQTTENQRLELKSYCDRMNYEIVKIYEDEVSGAKSREKRPAYNELCQDAFLKKFDAIIGWDVSRFGRSMKEFVSFLSDMDDKGIGVIAVSILLAEAVPVIVTTARVLVHDIVAVVILAITLFERTWVRIWVRIVAVSAVFGEPVSVIVATAGAFVYITVAVVVLAIARLQGARE